MLILQPPANTDDLHLRPSPLGVCLCMCAWCWGVCVRLWGLTDEATGSPATRVRVCVFVCSMGDGRNYFILCVSVNVCMWVQARVELSLKDAGRVTGPFSLASTFRRGAQILNWIICHLFTVHGANKWKNRKSKWNFSRCLLLFAKDRYIWLQTSPHPLVFSWGSLSMHYPLFV